MLSSLKWLLLLCLPVSAWADLTIFDMRRSLSMSDKDPVYRDFYLDGGTNKGLSVGMVLTVVRRLPLYDTYQNRSAGDLNLNVAKIKIVHVQADLAVARLETEFTFEGAPLLEDPFIMVGDKIDLASAQSGKKADNNEHTSPVASTSVEAKLIVNSVELSSNSKPEASQAPLEQNVEQPTLQ